MCVEWCDVEGEHNPNLENESADLHQFLGLT